MQKSTEENAVTAPPALPTDRGEANSARRGRNQKMSDLLSLSRSLPVMLCAVIVAAPAHVTLADDSKPRQAASAHDAGPSAKPIRPTAWSYPGYPQARQQVIQALSDFGLQSAAMQAALRPWPESEVGPAPDSWLDSLAESLHAAMPNLREVIDRAREPRKAYSVPDFSAIETENASPFIKNHLRLLAGRWLAQHEYYDEALAQFDGLEPNSLIDPATLLFHSASAHHQLLHKEECLSAVSKLLEQEAAIPARYRSLAQLMQADFRPLEPDSLDETSRLMESVERRLGLGRAGKRVRDEEDTVVAKLDKLIEDLEKQRDEQQKQQQSGAGATSPPSRPMEDSQAAGGKGPGNVDPKKIPSSGAWGNIPPKQRQEALQQLGRDLPAHYREVVEEYFRKLASEEKTPK